MDTKGTLLLPCPATIFILTFGYLNRLTFMRIIVRKWNFLILLSLLSISSVMAQDMTPGLIEIRKEPVDSVGAFFFFDSALVILNPRYFQIDTALNLFHHYQPLQKNGRAYAGLGNTGLPYFDLRYSTGFTPQSQFGIGSYDVYRLTPQNIPYYKLNIPFTVLEYTTGKHREQVFNGSHYQQVRRNLGVGLHFKVINSNGAYENQKAFNGSMAFNTLFTSRDKRYGLAANYIHNKFVSRENGGLLNPEQFELNLEPDRNLVSVNLTSAENRWRESNTYFKQYFHLKTPKTPVEEMDEKPKPGLGSLIHTFNYQRLAQVYEDGNPRSGFYNEILIDSVKTYDSLVLHTLFNDLQWFLPIVTGNVFNFTLSTGVSHVLMHYRMFDINEKYNQLIPHIQPTLSFNNKLYLAGTIRRVAGDFRDGDQEYGIQADYFIGDPNPLIISGRIRSLRLTPDLFYHKYQSNHFQWNNEFTDKQLSNELEFALKWRKTKAGISLTGFNGLVYLNESAHPEWYSDKFNLMSIFVSNEFRWRNFTLNNHITFQQISDQTVFRLPEFMFNSIIAYELDLFKGALQSMAGVEVYYNTRWMAPGYMPALRSFHLQNERETGNYIYADVFLNLRIKRVRLFLLMQHINEGWMDYNYYMIPYYPMPDRAFKFGVNWMFYD